MTILWKLFQAHQLEWLSLSPSCSIVFFSSLDTSLYFLKFRSVDCRHGKVHYSHVSLFMLTITKSSRMIEIKGGACISESRRILCVSFSRFPVGWVCRIHRLHLCRGVRPPHECRGYDTKQSDGEVLVMQELWGMRSTPSLPLLTGPLKLCTYIYPELFEMRLFLTLKLRFH